ncbi:MAG: EAL domain-containing protein [Microthrixaceae bacterium]
MSLEDQPNLSLEPVSGRSTAALLELLGASGDVIILINEDLTIRWVSQSVEKFAGWTPAQVASMDPGVLIHPKDIAHAMEYLADLLGGAPPESCRTPVRLRSSHGDWRWSEVTGIDLRELEGVNAVALSIRDTSGLLGSEKMVAEQANRFEALLRNSNDCIIVSDSDLIVTYVSSAMFRILGYEPDLALGHRLGTSGDQLERESMLGACAQVLEHPDQVVRLEIQVAHADGRMRIIENVLTNCLSDPLVNGIVTNFRDVTDQRAAAAELIDRNRQVATVEAESRRLIEMLNVTPDLTILADGQGTITYLNAAAREFFGVLQPQVDLGDPLELPVISNWLGALKGEVLRSLGENGKWAGELTLRRHDGLRVPMALRIFAYREAETGEVDFYSCVASDISERQELQASLQIQATHDQLTGLPNRIFLVEKLQRAVAGLHASPVPSRASLLFLDIDHFKKFNDTLGHSHGDQVLQQVAKRLEQVVRPGDIVARFGGDEFIVLCERLDAASDAVVIAHRINEAFLTPLRIDGADVAVGVSIGIAQIDPQEEDPLAVIRDADAAMYQAKTGGRGRWVIFDRKMGAQATQRRRIESWLRDSLEGKEFALEYQPVLSLQTGELLAVEALIRWNHEGIGIDPSEFVPIAEETGLIVPIGAWVLQTACAQLASWQKMPGWSGLRLAVNVSGRQLQDPGFNKLAAGVIAQYALTPHTLSVEITETVFLEDAVAWAERLEPLKQLGIGISLDDFGTGYSSLTYLRRLPADTVKLDQTFVKGLDNSDADKAILAAVISLCSTLGLSCIAEGIETPIQHQMLQELGCDAGQGHLFSPSLQPQEFENQFLNKPPIGGAAQ